MEVVGGLQEGSLIIANPGELAREGILVDPVLAAQGKPAAPKNAGK